MMATRLQSGLPAAQPSARSIGEDVADLLICVEKIDRRLADASSSDKWHWCSRRNVAIFLLNRLADKAGAAGTGITVAAIAPKQRQRVLSHHPLAGPLSGHSLHTSAEISLKACQQMRERVNHLYSS